MARPTVFISSTVKDFKDIRNALKFWLEEKGFEVYLSEASDLPRDSKLHTIDACLELVRKADIYILILGDYEGWTPPDEKLTITHLEFLESLKDSGKSSHVFVRKSVNDRYFKDPTSIPTEPLLKEVYLHRSAKGGQWVNYFEDFEEIAKVLKATLSLSKSISLKSLEQMMIKELEEFLIASTIKFKENLSRVSDSVKLLVYKLGLDYLDFGSDGMISMNSSIMTELTIIHFTYFYPRNKNFPAINAASVSEIYVDFDRSAGDVGLSELLIRIQSLSENLKFNFGEGQDQRTEQHYTKLYIYYSENKDQRGNCVVPVRMLALCLAQFLRYGQTCLEAESLFNHLKYLDPIHTKSLNEFPKSPFVRNQPSTESEKANLDDLKKIRDELIKRNKL